MTLVPGSISGGIHGRTETFLTNPASVSSLPAHTHSSRFMLLEISLKIKSRRCPVAFSAGLYITQ